MRMEEFANKKSPVYTNVAYDDHQTQREITRRVHEQMVQTGSVVQIPDDASEAIREYYPDLRRMKKTERTPILKQKMGELKTALRKILDGLKGTTYQFEINGNILDAKLYDTGIREVLEKITQNKAEMLTQSDAIFRNAQYLYSTPDYEGNSNIYRWNYFYSPVQIGTETVGVRIAVRDTMRPAESQIYNWNIKKAALDGEGRLPDGRSSSGVSSAADGTTDTAVAPSIAQPQTEVNPTADAENDGRLRLPTLEDTPQPSAERGAETNTAPVEGNGTQNGGAGVKISTPGGTDGPRFSIETIGGEPITVIDTQNDTREFAAAERYLKTLVDAEHPFSTILSDAQPVYLGKDLPGEYRESEYSKSMPRRLRAVKMQAATNLDEMLLLAENGEWQENVKPKHARDAKNGWYRYETQFAVPVLNAKKAIDRYTVYGGTLLIRNDADGKSYLYDLLDIEKKKVISTASFSAKPHSEVLPPKPSSEDIIRSGGQNVKWENSGQEKYTAESGLEGKTAFMAAYEAARTEKANRQNEPQYSLTQATEGRKMSSRSRRDVNQTMNAVRIAGDKKPESALRSLVRGTPEGTRTPNPQNRNLMLYPLSHWRVCLYIITHDVEKSSGGREKLRGGKPVPLQREMAAVTGKNPRPQTFENQAQRAAAGRA